MKKALLLPLLFIFCISCTSQESSVDRIEISINENSTVTINGSTVSESALKNHLETITIGEQTEVVLKVDEEAKMGLVTDLQKTLKQKSVKKISYSTTQS